MKLLILCVFLFGLGAVNCSRHQFCMNATRVCNDHGKDLSGFLNKTIVLVEEAKEYIGEHVVEWLKHLMKESRGAACKDIEVKCEADMKKEFCIPVYEECNSVGPGDIHQYLKNVLQALKKGPKEMVKEHVIQWLESVVNKEKNETCRIVQEQCNKMLCDYVYGACRKTASKEKKEWIINETFQAMKNQLRKYQPSLLSQAEEFRMRALVDPNFFCNIFQSCKAELGE